MSFTSLPFNIEGRLRSGSFGSRLPRPLNSPRTLFFLYGRNALYAALRYLKTFYSQKSALFPAYMCGDELEVALRLGYNVKLYPVREDLEIDESLIERIGSYRGVVLVTHYFGFIQKNIEIIAEQCRRSGAILIEDCAHCFGTFKNHRPAGTFGDFSIFSLRKHLPLPHGGALVVNNESLSPPTNAFLKPADAAVNEDFSLYLDYETDRIAYGSQITGSKDRAEGGFGPRLEKFGGYRLGFSRLAEVLIENVSVTDLPKRRGETFESYAAFFSKYRIYPIQKPLRGESPIIFLIRCPSPVRIWKECTKRGVRHVQPFWNRYHPSVDWKKHPREYKLKKTLLALPTATPMPKKDLIILSRMLWNT